MHHLLIDIGNTTTKVAITNASNAGDTQENPANEKTITIEQPIESKRLDGHDLRQLTPYVAQWTFSGCIISSTATVTTDMRQEIARWNIHPTLYLDGETPIPIINRYNTPQTLGTDRLAAVIGAYAEGKRRTGIHAPILVIDLGTAITYDFITAEGEYLGGNISPGIDMRLRALNAFTDKLPLVSHQGECPPVGHSTETAIRSGVINGVKHEIHGTIQHFLVKYPQLLIFLTGGDAIDFDEPLKKRIFADKFLVIKGLDQILKYNL